MNGEFVIAVHGLVYLNHRQDVVSSEVLAQNVCTNAARIRKVMTKLKKAGLIETKNGTSGGYLAVKELGQVNLKQVAEAVESRMVESSWSSGRQDMKCLIASGMSGIMEELAVRMNSACQIELEQVTIGEIEHRLLNRK